MAKGFIEKCGGDENTRQCRQEEVAVIRFVIAIGGLVAILVLGFCGSTPLTVSFVVCIF